MIFYFSGTGNSKQIALRIGQRTDSKVLSVSDHIPYTIDDNNEPIGFVFPIYFWGIPSTAIKFLDNLHITGNHYTYLVLNCGSMTGNAAGMVEETLRRKMDAIFSVQMPDTYVPMFDLTNSAEIDAILKNAIPKIDKIIAQIEHQEKGNFDRLHTFGKLLTITMFPQYLRKTTQPFKVSSSCVGCGLCSEVCPDNFITMEDNKPVWMEGHCDLCLSCLHHCPQHAISYGKRSMDHGQYLCPELTRES